MNEVIEAEIIETSDLINKELKNRSSRRIKIGAVLKGIIPRSNIYLKKMYDVFYC